MKKRLLLLTIASISLACKKNIEKDPSKPEVKQETIKEKHIPEALSKVIEAHGGIKKWNKAQTLAYKFKGETHTTDLHSRKALVKANDYALGYDGKEVWIQQQDSTAFKKDPAFYYHLFFYFYAMPFVLADDGIIYNDADSMVYEGVSYPGIKISYNTGVGVSPEDNYFVYYHPETYQMAWLGYTVTYFSKETSSKVKMIRYNDWHNVDGFVLPKSITWYKKDTTDGVLKVTEKVVSFTEAKVSEAAMEQGFYNKQSN